jgi:hypothetical protein
VHENAIISVPSERARYTAMGGVVFGTAILAMVSLGIGLYTVFDEFKIITLPIVLAWGWLVLNLDRWLMASSPEPSASKRLVRMVPRLGIAVVMGVMISEPLLLGVFHTAIEEHVVETRLQRTVAYESELRICNPADPLAVPATRPASCSDFILSTASAVHAERAELDSVRSDITGLRKDLDTDLAEYQRLVNTAAKECNGSAGSGRAGSGPVCARLQAEAKQLREDRRIDDNRERLLRLESREDQLAVTVADSRQEYAANIERDIAVQVAAYRASQRGIGLLERFEALGSLTSSNSYVAAAEWSLRLFIVIIDALPLLVRLLTGPTAYDRVVAFRIRRMEEDEEAALLAASEARREEMRWRDALTRLELERERERHADARQLHLYRESLWDRSPETGRAVIVGRWNEEPTRSAQDGGE